MAGILIKDNHKSMANLFATLHQEIPKLDFYFFKVCNSAHQFSNVKPSFYKLKNIILNQYAVHDCHDLQIIQRNCHNCGGTGWHLKGIACYKCDKGIYSIDKVALKRWVLNGELFHQPEGKIDDKGRLIITTYTQGEWGEYEKSVEYKPCNFIFRNTIRGLIKHEPLSTNPEFAFMWLLWNYDRQWFFMRLKQITDSTQAETRGKFRKAMKGCHSQIEGLAVFFRIKKEKVYDAELDDLPF